jgi:hypothetical protein
MRADEIDDIPNNGQHVIASGYEHLFRYLTSIGTRQFVAFPKRSTLRWPDGRKVTMQTTGLGGVRDLVRRPPRRKPGRPAPGRACDAAAGLASPAPARRPRRPHH